MTVPAPVPVGNTDPIGLPLEVEQSIPRCFEAIAGLHSNRKALGSGEWQPTYAGLNAAGNRLAHAILGQGGSVGDRVAVLTRHDTPQVAAVLSILKAGRRVVVMNPSDPPARLTQVLEDAGPHLILADAANRQRAGQIARGVVPVLDVEPKLSSGRADDPGLVLSPHDVAFLVYTSGSTGRPKGVMQTHRNILHNVRRLTRGMELGPDDRIMLPAALSGGHGVATLWCALINGAMLCPFPAMERGVTGLAEWINNHGITVFVSSASLFRNFARTLNDAVRFPRVRMVRLGSEPVTAEDFAAFCRHFSRSATLFHTFSSSETCNITQARYRHESRVPEGRLPVGTVVEGMEILLLDEAGREVGPGETGEIAVRSRYLSPGYWRNPVLTAERFSSVNGTDGLRLYRTGDLGRMTESNELAVLGRKDAQVKIHGYRVELSEVEDALSRQPEVDRAAVWVQRPKPGEPRLVASVVVRSGQTCTAEMLRERLRKSLPNYMVPVAFGFPDQLPLTAHGKVDREKLGASDIVNGDSGTVEPPETDLEKALARIWAEEFRREDIMRRSDFFELGGDSLRAAVVAARVHAFCGVELDMRMFLAHSRLGDLAGEIGRLLEKRGNWREEPIVRVSRQGALPLSFAQERTWKYSQTVEASVGFTVACSHQIRGPLRVEVLRECLDYLHRRHEILRTTFREENGEPVQVVHPPGPVSVVWTDLSGSANAEEQATALLREEARRPFDLVAGPLLRFRLVRLRSDVHQLLRINHHIISDGWSWMVYFRELAMLYEARLEGRPPPLPEFEPLQYADYAVWQRRGLRPEGRAYGELVEWWAAQYAGAPRTPELPLERFRNAPQAEPSDGFIWWGLEPGLAARLDRLGRSVGATYYGIRLAGFVALLAELNRQPDVVLGAYVTNRTRLESQSMFGFFANLAVLRMAFDRALTFRVWARVAQEAIAEVQARGEIPYEHLAEELRRRGVNPPALNAIFAVSDYAGPVRLGNVEMTLLDRRMEVMPWGFCLAFDRHQEATHCRVMFDAARYHPARVRRFIDQYIRLLDVVSARPDEPMAGLLGITGRGSWWSRLLRR